MISCHLSPPTSLSSHTLTPLLPQRKPAFQSGAEIKSLGAWPGPRPLANEVGERQAKSLPLGLYCLYRGLVIGGYGSGIKRLLPQPLRRVRHSDPPSSAPLPAYPPQTHIPLLPLSHRSFLFKRKGKECPLGCNRPRLSPSSSPPCARFPPSCSLPARYYVYVCLCVCTTCRSPVHCLPPLPRVLPCSVVLWLLAVSFCGCSGLTLLSVRECLVLVVVVVNWRVLRMWCSFSLSLC